MNEPLIVIIEKTKAKINTAVNKIICESGLPAYLLDGILMGIVADVKDQKNVEMMQAVISQDNSELKDKTSNEKEGEEYGEH